jgi:hypothetical protein
MIANRSFEMLDLTVVQAPALCMGVSLPAIGTDSNGSLPNHNCDTDRKPKAIQLWPAKKISGNHATYL